MTYEGQISGKLRGNLDCGSAQPSLLFIYFYLFIHFEGGAELHCFPIRWGGGGGVVWLFWPERLACAVTELSVHY